MKIISILFLMVILTIGCGNNPTAPEQVIVNSIDTVTVTNTVVGSDTVLWGDSIIVQLGNETIGSKQVLFTSEGSILLSIKFSNGHTIIDTLILKFRLPPPPG